MKTMNEYEITRVKNDINGNSRRVVHFLAFITEKDRTDAPDTIGRISWLYGRDLAKARKLGGRKFHNRQFGGGIVFQAQDCEMNDLINRALAIEL